MKALIRSALAELAATAGVLRYAERSLRNTLTVLCYHRVLPEEQRKAYHDPDLVVTPEVFRAHCRLLAERYTVERLDVALSKWQSGDRPARPLAAITFDDGYRDNFRYAAPILNEFGLRATFYVIAGLVDSEELPWYDTMGAAWRMLATADEPTAKQVLAEAKGLSPQERAAWVERLRSRAGKLPIVDDDHIMTSAQVRALADAGHEIGSHTMTHPLLPQCDDATLAMEIDSSRRILADLCGREIIGLCYPNGDSDDRVHREVVAAGYGYATSLQPGTNEPPTFDKLRVRRWFINQDRLAARDGSASDAVLRMELSGVSQRLFARKRAA